MKNSLILLSFFMALSAHADLIQYTFKIDDKVEIGLRSLQESTQPFDAESKFTEVGFSNGKVCDDIYGSIRGEVDCRDEEKEECRVVLENGNLAGKDGVQEIINKKEITGVHLFSNYYQDDGNLGHATFHTFSSFDKSNPSILQIQCYSRLKREINIEAMLGHIGNKRIQASQRTRF